MSLSNQVIKEIQKGNKPFKILYDSYYVQVFRFIYQKIESVDTAKDITSDTFIKVYQNLNKYKDMGKPFDAWLYRLAYNEVMGFYRKTKQNRFYGIDEMPTKSLADELDIQEKLINEDLVRLLFKGLKEDDVELINLRFVEGRPFLEIGEILNLNEGAVKMKIYRLVKELKEKFKAVIQ